MTLGADAEITIRSGLLAVTVPMDPDNLGSCDEAPPEDGSVRIAIGAPYNGEPITLYYDEFRVTASP